MAPSKKHSVSSVRQTVSRSRSRSKRPHAQSPTSEGPRSSPEGEITPKASRKRARAARHVVVEDKGREGEEEDGEGMVQQDEVFPNERRESSSPVRPASRSSSVGDAHEEFHVRRKRARH
jgi:hypothetical protein